MKIFIKTLLLSSIFLQLIQAMDPQKGIFPFLDAPIEMQQLIVSDLMSSIPSIAAIKTYLSFNRCSKHCRALITGDHFITQVATAWATDAATLALIFGDFESPLYKEKKEQLEQLSKIERLEDVINSKCSYSREPQRTLNNFKYSPLGLLVLLKLRLPYDIKAGFRTAAKVNDPNLVQFFTTMNNITQSDLNQALQAAAKKLAFKTMRQLIELNADITTRNRSENTVLLRTIRDYYRNKTVKSTRVDSSFDKFLSILNLLITPSTINERNDYRFSPIDHALLEEDSVLAQFLINNGADTSECDEEKLSDLLKSDNKFDARASKRSLCN